MATGKYQRWLEPDSLILIQGWARDGLTQEQIAHNMGCSLTTLKDWISKFPTISTAIKKGREVVDFEVENALVKRALGYSYMERQVTEGPDGSRTTRVTEKHVPGDVGAMIFYLKNRGPKKWKDKPIDDADEEQLQKLRQLLGGIPSAF